MAAIQNHLLSFSVLALLNAHLPASLAHTHLNLSSKQLTIHDFTDYDGVFVYKDIEGDATLATDGIVWLEYESPSEMSPAQDDEWIETVFFRQSGGKLNSGNSLSIELKAQNVQSAVGMESNFIDGFIAQNSHHLNLSLNASSTTQTLENAVTWAINDSVLTNEQLPEVIDIKLQTQGLADDAIANALQVSESTVNYKGTLRLSAQDLDQNEKVYALKLYGSQFHFESSGNSVIKGDVNLNKNSKLYLHLSHASDLFEGRIVNSEYESTQSHIVLSSSAKWVTHGDNALNRFDWKKDGILDLTHAQDTVRINNHNLNNDCTSSTRIEDGAILRVNIRDSDIGSNHYKLELGEVSPITSDGSRVFVEIIDSRTDKTTDEINVGLISVENVDDSYSKFFAEALPSYYETALGSFKTQGAIGTDGRDGFVITSMVTDRIGASGLVKNILDFTSGATVAHEQNADRVFSTVSDRLSQSQNRGLWTDVRIQETELNLDHRSRSHRIDTKALTLGYDRNVKLPVMNEGIAGLWLSHSQTDSDLEAASGEINETAFGFYLHGITEDNYRLILLGHYGVGDHSITSDGVFGTDLIRKCSHFKEDAQTYGVGLYFGFVHPEISNEWFFEPFVSGYTYWIKRDPTNTFEGVSFQTEKEHQSITKIGVTAGHRITGSAPLSLYAQAAWVHRFGQSMTLEGQENGNAETFKTENLQESWGYLKLSGQWQIDRQFAIGAQASAFASKVVKPKYEIGINGSYLF